MNHSSLLNDLSVLRLVQIALNEDVGTGDVTSESLIPEDAYGHATFISRSGGIVSGTSIAALVLNQVDRGIAYEWAIKDGQSVEPGTVIGHLDGPMRSILTAERTALNFMQRMSGVATKTNQFVQAIAGTGAAILDTRKTLPGWRLLDKYAVVTGGGRNHRMGLYDMVMIKDNHIEAHGSLPGAVEAVLEYFSRNQMKGIPVEVETRNLEEVQQALDCRGVQRIMFDNFSLEMTRQAVRLVGGARETEASGDVNMQTVRGIAETGVDFISVGGITHSATALNISLEVTAPASV